MVFLCIAFANMPKEYGHRIIRIFDDVERNHFKMTIQKLAEAIRFICNNMLGLVDWSEAVVGNKNKSLASGFQYTGNLLSKFMAANYMLQNLRSDDNVKQIIR